MNKRAERRYLTGFEPARETDLVAMGCKDHESPLNLLFQFRTSFPGRFANTGFNCLRLPLR